MRGVVADELFLGSCRRLVSGGRNRMHHGRDCADLLRKVFFEKVEKRQLPMTRLAKRKLLLAAMAATLAFGSESVHACAMCYGKTDSPLAAAMNWGIFSLLGVIVSVLVGIASVGIFFVRKAAACPPPPMPNDSQPPTNKA